MDSNKDMQDLFEFQTRQRLQASQEECLKLIQAMKPPAVLSGEPNLPLPAWLYNPNTFYCRGYQNGYLDGFNAGVEHVVSGMKNQPDAEEVKDGFK